MIRRTYDGWGYSPLDQITPANVARLQPVWVFSTGVDNGHEAPPIVNNGVMFVATPGNQVIAHRREDRRRCSGATGGRCPRTSSLLHPTPAAASRSTATRCSSPPAKRCSWRSTRRPARRSGRRRSPTTRTATTCRWRRSSPTARCMVGASGGELGIRGFVAAFDAETGKELWRTYTVPAPGEPGSETWPKGDQWKTGGAPVWVTGNYDPETNLAFWGTGNGGPWMGDQRPGDNLYTASTVAIDVATGAIKGHFQYHPNESWDWDEVSPPILVDYQRNGRTVKGLIDVARNGYLWFLERTDGPIKFVEGKPYVKQNVFRSLDPKTGRPDVDPARKPGTGKTAEFCPSHWGGKNWPPIAFSPKTRMIYIPANENLCAHDRSAGRSTYTPGSSFTGATSTLYARAGRRSHRRSAGVERRHRQARVDAHVSRSRRTGGRCWRPAAGSCSAAAPTIASSARSTRRAASCCGSSRPTPASSASHRRSRSTASSTSPCSRAGASTPRAMQARLNRPVPGEFPRCPRAARSGCLRFRSNEKRIA